MRFLSGDVRTYFGRNQQSIVCRGTETTGNWANHALFETAKTPDLDTVTK
jgi:hypothetical protein